MTLKTKSKPQRIGEKLPRIITLKSNSQAEITDYPTGVDSLKFLQNAVGGYIEFIDLPKQKAVMVVNEEGKLHNLPTNVFATALFYQNYTHLRDFIVGDVAFLSAEGDENGDPSGFSDQQVANLLNEINWLIDEVKSDDIDRRETDREYYAESQGE
jgi:hypothetical protein